MDKPEVPIRLKLIILEEALNLFLSDGLGGISKDQREEILDARVKFCAILKEKQISLAGTLILMATGLQAALQSMDKV